jgi:hypothetical protein
LPFGIAWNITGNGPGEAGSLASDFGDRASTPASTQPTTSFLMQPPVNVVSSPQLMLSSDDSCRVGNEAKKCINLTEFCTICQEK